MLLLHQSSSALFCPYDKTEVKVWIWYIKLYCGLSQFEETNWRNFCIQQLVSNYSKCILLLFYCKMSFPNWPNSWFWLCCHSTPYIFHDLAPFFLIVLLFKVKYCSQPYIRPVRRSCIVSVQFSSEAHHAWHGIGNSTYWIWTITKMQHNPNFQFSKWTFGNGHTFFLP